MINIVGVRFKNAGKIYYFDPVDFEIEEDMDVVVETARGLEYGTIVVGKKEIDEESLVSPLKPIIRIATEEDTKIYKENKEKAKETFEPLYRFCKSTGQNGRILPNSIMRPAIEAVSGIKLGNARLPLAPTTDEEMKVTLGILKDIGKI